VQAAWKLCVQNGMAFVDSAQSCCSGEAERIHGSILKDIPRSQTFVQTKWYVVPDNATNLFSPSKAPAKMLRYSLQRLDLEYTDCYLFHGHIHASSIY
jgi:aryl-alcohol dehydrogenase-like predicted oxidoreductase